MHSLVYSMAIKNQLWWTPQVTWIHFWNFKLKLWQFGLFLDSKQKSLVTLISLRGEDVGKKRRVLYSPEWNLMFINFGLFFQALHLYLYLILEILSMGSIADKRTDVWSRDFMIWKINFGLWAVAWARLWNKRVGADYEQLLRPVISLFQGQKKFKFFWKH